MEHAADEVATELFAGFDRCAAACGYQMDVAGRQITHEGVYDTFGGRRVPVAFVFELVGVPPLKGVVKVHVGGLDDHVGVGKLVGETIEGRDEATTILREYVGGDLREVFLALDSAHRIKSIEVVVAGFQRHALRLDAYEDTR